MTLAAQCAVDLLCRHLAATERLDLLRLAASCQLGLGVPVLVAASTMESLRSFLAFPLPAALQPLPLPSAASSSAAARRRLRRFVTIEDPLVAELLVRELKKKSS